MSAYKFTSLQLKWLTALESGRFLQGKKVLAKRQPNKHVRYCCLGVACRLAKIKSIISDKVGLGKVLEFDGHYSVLSEEMQSQLKLRSQNGKFAEPAMFKGSEYYSLANMNDCGFSHKEIAAYIRAHPENVFS